MALLAGFRFDRRELAGGLGDAGLFIPIAVALIAVNGLNATAVFGGAGLAYVITALYFRVPVPVQPLKAFAAAAIALKLTADVIAAGALLMALAMTLLSLSGAAGWLAQRFPLVLVRGVQAAVAMLLAKAAIDLAAKGNWTGPPAVSEGASLAVAVLACGLLFWGARRRFPGALIVLAAGAVAGIAIGGAPHLALGPQAISFSFPDGAAFATALTALVIAQIPLTFGNSVVATADAERTYFGEGARRVRPGSLAASIAAVNLVAGLGSGLPACHGAGGVTAHYRLGARTAGATLMTGALYLGLAILLGASLPGAAQVLLPGALAGMLFYVALQHALLAAQLERGDDRLIAFAVGALTLFTGNLGIGFGLGVVILVLRGAIESLGQKQRERARKEATIG